MSTFNLSSAPRNLALCAAALAGGAMIAPQAHAAFHLWGISEIYTNSTGTLQFIELNDSFGGQNFIGGQQISALNLAHTLTHTFTIPNITLGGNTFGHSLLFGTAGIQAAGAPAPDFILPDGFLFAAGGSINFFGLNSGSYSALPTDVIHSRIWQGADAINSPTNFAGRTGSIVPSPGSLAIVAAGGCLAMRSRRRSAAPMRSRP